MKEGFYYKYRLYIYKITNKINGKIYIGQTSRTIEKRWEEHKIDSKRKNTYRLYKAINKYGIDNFIIEEIEKCEIDKLNEKEIYWINYYDSYHNGYNSTLGGEGTKLLNLNELEVVNKYEELGTLTETAKFFGCSHKSIQLILSKNNIKIRSAMEISKDKGLKVDMLNENENLLMSFNSLHEAGTYIFNKLEKPPKKIDSCDLSIKRGIILGIKVYGYYWKSNGFEEEYIDEFIKKETIRNKIYKDLCPFCNQNLKNKQSSKCFTCNTYSLVNLNKVTREEFFFKKLKLKIQKEELMYLVRNKSFIEIGKLYNVSDNTIKKWCKKYLIPFKKQDIIKISNEDWEVECNLSKEEYERKYLNKRNKIPTDKEIIDFYLETKTLKSVCKKFHKDRVTIKKILEKNNISLS